MTDFKSTFGTKQILITGGAGFVGSHLADRLLREGHDVRVLDNLTFQVHPDGSPSYLDDRVELIIGDVRDADVLHRALADVDIIFHFAATVGVGQSMYEISRYVSANALGTAELLQALLDNKASVAKLIVASSMSIYGEGAYGCEQCKHVVFPKVRSITMLKRGVWDLRCSECQGRLIPRATTEEKPSEINSVYALSKRDQEELCLIYGRTYNLPVTALRFFNIYGTRQSLSNPYTGVAAIFASRLINNQAPLVFEDGEQMRDFVHVDDIVTANILAMTTAESDGEVINIGSGTPVTIRQVAGFLATALGKEDFMPSITKKYRAGDIRHCFADISKARKLLKYEPQVSHGKGFSELAVWLKEQSAADHAEIMLQQLGHHGLTA